MCGAFGTDPDLKQNISKTLGIDIGDPATPRFRPTDVITSIVQTEEGLAIHRGRWGIKPSWSKQLLINARAESIDSKPTFQQQYRNHRCLIPISFWFDNQKDPVNKKIIGRYRFTSSDSEPLYMAGIYYPEQEGRIVSLTTAPVEQVQPFKDRMPLIFSHDIDQWLKSGNKTHVFNGLLAIEELL